MSLLWSDLRSEVRVLLDDMDSSKYKWTDAQLLTLCGMALDSLCSHTAIASATSYPCDGQNVLFPVPSNYYERIDRSGALFFKDTQYSYYLNPLRYDQIAYASAGYYLNPETQINCVNAPAADKTLWLYYFARYPHPINDSDDLLTPLWATTALANRISAYACSQNAARAAFYRQVAQSPDIGNPVQNPMKDMADYFYSVYWAELQQYPRQERDQYFRSSFIGEIPLRLKSM